MDHTYATNYMENDQMLTNTTTGTEVQSLAATLRKNGIAATELDAKRMATEMLAGSQRVATQHADFRRGQKAFSPAAQPLSDNNEPTSPTSSQASVESINEQQAKREETAHKEFHERIAGLETELQQERERTAELETELAHMRERITGLQEEMLKSEQEKEDVGVVGSLEENRDPEPDTPFVIVDTQSDVHATSVQDDVLHSDMPLADMMNPIREEIKEDLVRIEQPAQEQVDIAEAQIEEPFHIDEQKAPENVAQELHVLEQQDEHDKQEYQEEQEELGFIGEEISPSINTKEDAPPEHTVEVEVSREQQESRGTGLSHDEKSAADLTKHFNFSGK